MKAGSSISPNSITNTGASQACVGSSILYSLYTNDFMSECDSNILNKYSDDAAVVKNKNFLELIVCKTTELCTDFRTSGQFERPLCIGDEAVEVTDIFKYIGITLDNKLTFGPHV